MKSATFSFALCKSRACFLISCYFIFVSVVFSQEQGSLLTTEIYSLDNGLTVYLNEDHTLPNVFGAVAVKGGSKRDPADATGIAHYFEHIMFKGTDSIGTLNYQLEKFYLDSIAALYDELSGAINEEEKEKIQIRINQLSVKSAQYAIPNEFGKVLGEMGGTMVNAGTGNEEIVYYNIFPSGQIEKWLRLYSHRFIHPVYRLFQSELETVYEEYNMYKDSRFSTAFEEFIHAFYPDHPYGVPVIGYPEHLKNPSMKKMDEYFQTFYVANNMALVLSGNFNTDEIKPLISAYFGKWKRGELPPLSSEYTIQPLKGRNVFQKKMTPVKFGVIVYRSIPIGHPDEPVLDVINSMLSNRSSTGLLDKLSIDHKLMQAGSSGMRFLEGGGELVIFVPKVIGQSLKKAERLVSEQLDSLKAGNFNEGILEAVKTDFVVNYQRSFEDQYGRGYMMITAFCEERDWQEIMDYPEKIKNVSRDDVINIARKYYGDDYLVCYSKTGFPKKPETLKPPIEHITAVNTEMQSDYARSIENMPTAETEPDFIEFGPPGMISNEVTLLDLNPLVHVYHTENKVNDLFNLAIRFGIGTHEMAVLSQLEEYMRLTGTTSMSLTELSGGLQKLGASYYFNADKNNFSITITGLDMNIDTILALVTDLLYNPAPDDKKIDNLVESFKARDKMEQEDPETIGVALYYYAVFGDRSPFINRLSEKEVKDLKADTLLSALKKVMHYEADIHYSGKIPLADLETILKARFALDSIFIKSQSPVRNEFRDYDGPVVFFLNDKKAIQSKDYFFIPGDLLKEDDKPYLHAYYEYLDGGMQSIIFQEIRELRSFAYASGAFIVHPFYPDEKSSLTAYVGTQADKTREAVEVMFHILSTQPEKSDRIDMVRKSLIQSVNSNKPGFRGISLSAAHFHEQNYTVDPRKHWVEVYKEMSFNDIVGIYDRQYFHKPSVITIIGDESKIGTDWMSKYGKIIRVNKEDIFR